MSRLYVHTCCISTQQETAWIYFWYYTDMTLLLLHELCRIYRIHVLPFNLFFFYSNWTSGIHFHVQFSWKPQIRFKTRVFNDLEYHKSLIQLVALKHRKNC